MRYLVRFTAAFMVFAGHLSGHRLTGGLFWQASPYMGMAVAIFFVLSGFVIGHVTQQRETDARTYAVSRAARLYSVALPAIVITVVLDAIGRTVAPELYTNVWGFSSEKPVLQILTALSFTQRSFGLNLDLGSDLPYWSLNYEVAYYVAFGILAYAKGWFWKYVSIAIVLAASGWPVIAMFPLWIFGMVLARLRPWEKIGRSTGRTLLVCGIAGFAAYEIWAAATSRLLSRVGPAFRPELAQDYLVAALFLAALTGLAASHSDFAALRHVERPVRWLAGRTFSLYLYHLPVAQFLAAISPWPIASAPSRLLVFGGTLGIVLALAQVTELRKPFWRRAFESILKPPRPTPKNTLPAR